MREMEAIRLHAPGGPEDLVLDRIAMPEPQAGEALVEVYAAAITKDELGWPAERLPAIPSYELSGVVTAVASGVDTIEPGDAVYALTSFDHDGVAADYAAVPADVLASKPRTLDHVESAAVPLAALSAWQALFDHGRLEKGQRVLITGAAGGVGHFATQLAHRRGAYVIALTSPAGGDQARGLGADEVFADGRMPTSLEPVDLVLDTAGGDLLEQAPSVIRAGGRLVTVVEEPPRDPERREGHGSLLHRRVERRTTGRDRGQDRRWRTPTRYRLGLSTRRRPRCLRAQPRLREERQGRSPGSARIA